MGYKVDRLPHWCPVAKIMPILQRPLASPFDANSTAAEVIQGIDLNNKNVIVTGASAGIGIEIATALASAGAHVVIAVRSVEKGQAVARQICQSTGNENVEVAYVDLGIWSSVRALANCILEKELPIHILINNAGMMPAEKQCVEGGIEARLLAITWATCC